MAQGALLLLATVVLNIVTLHPPRGTPKPLPLLGGALMSVATLAPLLPPHSPPSLGVFGLGLLLFAQHDLVLHPPLALIPLVLALFHRPKQCGVAAVVWGCGLLARSMLARRGAATGPKGVKVRVNADVLMEEVVGDTGVAMQGVRKALYVDEDGDDADLFFEAGANGGFIKKSREKTE